MVERVNGNKSPPPSSYGMPDALTYFHGILQSLWNNGKECAPRGLKVKELCAFSYTLPPRVRFMCFDRRALKLDYVKQEFLWYLRGDNSDLSIGQLAKLWNDLVNPDGTINSNYGYYLFNPVTSPKFSSNFERIALELERDPDSRRAAVMILANSHLCSETKDYPCTAYINFLIRDKKLMMFVRMRSQDAIWGMGNDAPCFSLTHELMWTRLRAKYPDLELGIYQHMADSFHVYERHFEMIESIVKHPIVIKDMHKDCPWMTEGHTQSEELLYAAKNTGEYKGQDLSNCLPFTRWLLSRDDPATLL